MKQRLSYEFVKGRLLYIGFLCVKNARTKLEVE